MNNILIIGSTSTIGSYFKKKLDLTKYNITETTRNRNHVSDKHIYLDLKNIDDFLAKRYVFDSVIIFAGITKIKKCELEPDKCFLVNYTNTLNLVNYFISKHIFVVCFSSDNVFNGTYPNVKYSDKLSAVSIYGKSKALLENGLKNKLDKVCILRMTKVVESNNLLFKSWIKKLQNNLEINPFDDVYISPISLEYLFSVLILIIENRIFGIQQVSAFDQITYYEAAKYLSKKFNLNNKIIKPIKCINLENNHCPKYASLYSTFTEIINEKVSSFDAINYFIKQQKHIIL